MAGYIPVASTADVAKIYRQIRVQSNNTDFQRIVWSLQKRCTHGTAYLQRYFYINDLMIGADAIEKARKLCTELRSCLRGGFDVRKWNWKPNEMLKFIQEHRRESVHSFNFNQEGGIKAHVHVDAKPLSMIRLTISTEASTVASQYDPLRLLQRIIIKVINCMQKLRLQKLEWDEDLSPELV